MTKKPDNNASTERLAEALTRNGALTETRTEGNAQELLSELQRNLKVPKNRDNTFGGYKYRNAEDIMEAVKPHLPEGATLICTDDLQIGHNANYIRATAVLQYKDSLISASALARESVEKKKFDNPQLTGSASSYARKYALNGLLLLDDIKDADTNEHAEAVKKAETEQNAADEKVRGELQRQITAIRALKTKEEISSYIKENPLKGASEKQLQWFDEQITAALTKLEK